MNLVPSSNPLVGMRLRYLIGAGSQRGRDGEVTEVAYDVDENPTRGVGVKYCNLFDEKNTGDYGPYLSDSDTAEEYDEGQIDPRGEGWERNLTEQFARAAAAGFLYIELDNPDAYSVKDVVGAVDLAARGGLRVLAKNPLIMRGNPRPYLLHPSVVGVIVERGCGSPADMHALRVAANKPDLPVWFVSFGRGRNWANTVAETAKKYSGMFVTYSKLGEYGSSEDVL